MIERIVVVFPEPFGPRKPRISPSRTVSDTSSNATVAPNRFEIPDTSSIPSKLAVRPARMTRGRPSRVSPCTHAQQSLPLAGDDDRRGLVRRSAIVVDDVTAIDPAGIDGRLELGVHVTRCCLVGERVVGTLRTRSTARSTDGSRMT